MSISRRLVLLLLGVREYVAPELGELQSKSGSFDADLLQIGEHLPGFVLLVQTRVGDLG